MKWMGWSDRDLLTARPEIVAKVKELMIAEAERLEREQAMRG